MLDAIKKKLGLTAPVVEAAVEAPIEAAVEAVADATLAEATLEAHEVKSTEFSVMGTKLEAALASFAGAQEALAQMTQNFEAAQAALNALTAEKAELAVKAEAAKYSARKEKVVSAIGSNKADGVLLAMQGMDDASFEAVVGALAGSVDAEAKTGLFTEVGVAGSPDTTNIVVESKEMTIIKKKYNKAK